MAVGGTPATESIMSALPPEKAGVGSAMNDTTREMGGALGVAVLGSVMGAAYGDHMVQATADLPGPAGDVARDGLAGALAVSEHLSAGAAAQLMDAAKVGFTAATGTASLVGALIALTGALVAWVWLPKSPDVTAPAGAPQSAAVPVTA